MRQTLRWALCLTIAAAEAASAQVCLGNASFSNGSARIGARYVDMPSTNLLGVSAAVGRALGTFGSVEYTRLQPRNLPNDVHDNDNGLGATIGRDMKLSSSDIHVCPIAGFGYRHASSSFSQTSSSLNSNTFTVGAAAGFSTDLSPTVRMIPSLEMDYRAGFTNGSSTTSGVTRNFYTARQDYGYWTAAVGFAVERWTIAPTLERSFGMRYATTVWGVRASYNFTLPSR